MSIRRNVFGIISSVVAPCLACAASALRFFTATVLAVAVGAVDVCAADPSTAAAASAPKTCTGAWDFIATDCQLTWQGFTIYGAIDAGVSWQNHGAPFDPRSAVGASYLLTSR